MVRRLREPPVGGVIMGPPGATMRVKDLCYVATDLRA